jgi:hypothetical protein
MFETKVVIFFKSTLSRFKIGWLTFWHSMLTPQLDNH